MILNDRIYVILKWVCLIFIPAFTTMLSVVLSTWNVFPAETINAIITTITAVGAFIGTLIGISNANYNRQS